ncbi:MAG: exodeoxyribonuclease VII small subunit [Desulfobulbaceae bacterium]|nr:exodeoxyribonuclease VII small subunit [Desulfobulbaceae bacterium]
MAKKNFETSLQKLEQITDELEEGELSLEESLKKFQEGINLVNFCNSKLDEARTKVDLLIQQNDSLSTVPFNEEKNEH